MALAGTGLRPRKIPATGQRLINPPHPAGYLQDVKMVQPGGSLPDRNTDEGVWATSKH
jgi:hypothetical protein